MPFTRVKKKLDPDELAELFAQQAEPFLKSGFVQTGASEDDNHTLENLMLRLISALKDSMSSLRIVGLGHIPFLIVVPQRFLATEVLRVMASCEDMSVTSPNTSRDAMDITTPPETPYLLVDVEDGRVTDNLAMDEGVAVIQKADRFPLTLHEGLTLALHDRTPEGERRPLILAGSVMHETEEIPIFCARGAFGSDGRWIRADGDMRGRKGLGTPSYARRIISEVVPLMKLAPE